jgi:hypothetical protein
MPLRLVEQQQPAGARERHGQGETLALTGREPHRRLTCHRGQRQPIK